MSERNGRRSLLIVEDDPAQLAEYAQKLRELGYKVFSATSAEEGIGFIQSQAAAVDVILTDNILPSMTGLRSIAEFAKCSRAPVFIMTSHPNSESEEDALLLGARAYLKKPLVFAQLHEDLQAAIASANKV
jgi:CheY-like chemotaxis protein